MILSVAMCTFNGEKYIAEQLESILSQQFPVDEIIICDDGSTDKTVEIIEDFQKSNPFIKLYRNPENLGVIKNFEKAINLCQDGIVLLCDQDDIWFKNKTKKIKNYFETNLDKKAVFHNLELFNEKPLSATIWDYVAFNAQNHSKNLLNHLLTIENLATGASFAFKKNKSINLDEIPEIALHDYQLALIFAMTNELGLIDETLGYYRIHDAQQIGAEATANGFIKKLTNLFYSSGHHLEKVDYLIKKQEMWAEYQFQFVKKEKILAVFEKLRSEFLKQHLHQFNFFHKKAILLYWLFRKKYNVNLNNVLWV